MRWTRLAALTAAFLLSSAPILAREVIDTESFSCGTVDVAAPLTDFHLRGALASAETVRIVRAPRLLPSGEAVPWCLSLYDPRLRGPFGCRTNGPEVTTGALELTVAETIIGEPAETLELRLGPIMRGAFIGEFVSEDPKAVCTAGSRHDVIDGQTHFTPTLYGLDPAREFLLTIGKDLNGGTMVAALGLPIDAEPFKQFMRDVASAREEVLRKQAEETAKRRQ